MKKTTKTSKTEVTTEVKRGRPRKAQVTEAVLPSKPPVRAIGVKFKNVNTSWACSDHIYDYLVDGLDFEVGDTAVVLTPSSGLQLADVVAVYESPKGIKYVVDKVDLSGHKARLEKAQLKEQLTKELLSRKNQIDENRILDLYAKEDKEFAAILAKLRAI